MSASLFYENFIDQFIEDQELRSPLKELVEKIATLLPESSFGEIKHGGDDASKEEIESMQLRWDKELSECKDEKKRYLTIKQTIGNIIHTDIQKLFKDRAISDSDKKQILTLKKAIE